MKLGLRAGDDVRILWILSAGIFICGYVLLNEHYESKIGLSTLHSRQLQEQSAATKAAIDRLAAYKALERRARGDLQRIGNEGSDAVSTAAFLVETASLARHFGVSVLSIATETQSPPSRDQNTELNRLPFSARLRGTFSSILGFIQALPRQRALIGVDDIEIQSQAQLVTTLHATLYRIVSPRV